MQSTRNGKSSQVQQDILSENVGGEVIQEDIPTSVLASLHMEPHELTHKCHDSDIFAVPPR